MSRLEPSCALEIRGLRKHFDRPAVDGLDLVVRSGEIYALLGPNGAGKTTALRMVAGLLRPDAGSISILGIDVLRERVVAGGTVILTTHILEVAERMADRIGVIAAGRLIAEGTLDDLRRSIGRSSSTLEETFLTLVADRATAA